MNKEMGLEKIATKDDHWLDAIESGIRQGINREDSIAIYGQGLATRVAVGLVNIKNLRQAVRWANALDGEAYSYANGDISSLIGDDLEEAAARRFAHHAMKSALNQVDSWSQRNSFFATKAATFNWPDLSRFGNG